MLTLLRVVIANHHGEKDTRSGFSREQRRRNESRSVLILAGCTAQQAIIQREYALTLSSYQPALDN